jgi:hypothetical protein
LLGALLSCVLCLVFATPIVATTVATPRDDGWLQVDPDALHGVALDAVATGGAAGETFGIGRGPGPARLISNFQLVDQAGAAGSWSALRSDPGVTPARRRSLAGGPGEGGKGETARRNRQRREQAHRQTRRREAARAAAARRAERQRRTRIGRRHGPGPVDRLTVDLGVLFTTQFDGSRYANINCTMAAAAMLYEVQTGRPVSGGQMRRWSRSRRRGTGLLEIERAFRRGRQPVKTYEDLPWGKFVRAVAEGRSAVVMGWYGHLPDRYVLQKGFKTAHSVFVLGYSGHAFGGRGGFFVMDPLGRGGYAGQWWTRKAMWRFAWRGKAGVHGSGPRAFRGSVAFQMNRSVKKLGRAPVKPRFRSYWATAKELMRRSERVRVPARTDGKLGPRFANSILRVHDKQLRMVPSKAARWNSFRWPLARTGRITAGYSRTHRSLTISTRAGTRVVAAAPGRVVFRTWNRNRRGDTVYVMHGLRLFTIYHNLSRSRVEPGQWVNRGSTLGYVSRARKHQRYSRVRFAVVTSSRPFELWGRDNPRVFLRSLRPSQF